MSQQINFPPLSGRQIAAYLGVSSSQVCMSNSDNYMNRQLGPAQSLKMTELMQAHMLSQQKSADTPSVRQMQKREGDDCARLAKKMKGDADYILKRIPRLEKQLAAMKPKARQDTDWLNTVDRLIAKLPPVTTPKSHERIWLENQQVIVLKRLQKNGILPQMKLEVQIEMEKAKARVYHAAYLNQAKK